MSRTTVGLEQIAPLPAILTPLTIREEPAQQIGSTFFVKGHKVGWDLPVFLNGLLLRFAVEYTLSYANGVHTIKLPKPLGVNDHIQWVKSI